MSAGNGFRPGELVRLTIEGVVQEPRLSDPDGLIRIQYAEVQPGIWTEVRVDHLDAKSVAIERVAPVEWPPRYGDLWRDAHGELWFAYRHESGGDYPRTELRLQQASSHAYSGQMWPEKLLSERGPVELVRREHPDPDTDDES